MENKEKRSQIINNQGQSRGFGLTTLALKNKTTVFVLTFLIVIMGITSYIGLPKESFPEIKQPIVYIGTPHPGNSPVDIENLITRPIEKELNTISDVEKITSTSVQDYSTVMVEFSTSTDIEDALSKVKDAVDRARPELPNDLQRDPNIFEMNFAEFPVMNINLSGDFSVEELNEYAEFLQDEIEKLPEISKVDIRGVDEKEVTINVDPYQMEARMVNFGDIEAAIRSENITLSGGNIKEGEIRRSLRIVGEFNEINELLEVVIKREHGRIVYLRDIASVSFDYKEKENFARLQGQSVVMVDVIKRSGENLLTATDKINHIIDIGKSSMFPKELIISKTNDQSARTKMMVDSLENNIISGVILVVIVLLFFLGSRNALFVGLAIPLSMFISFIVLGIFGITINMMVLFSLIMALGMLVDNGIVVVENVYRLREEGIGAFEATKRGVGEVALPIIASTATTLAAFLPLAFWPGLMGSFMKFLPITLIITLTSSLFVALVINPVLIQVFMKLDTGEKTNHRRIGLLFTSFVLLGIFLFLMDYKSIGNLSCIFGLLLLLNTYVLSPVSRNFQQFFLPWLENKYLKILQFALNGWRAYLFFFGTVSLLILSFALMTIFPPNIVFFPKTDPKYINIFVEFPVGTDVKTTDEFSREIESKLITLLEPYNEIIESVIANVGQGTTDPNDPSAFGQKDTPNKARLTVNFKEFQYRNGISTGVIMDDIRTSLTGYPGVTITVDQNSDGPPTGKPINIEITGHDFGTLVTLTERMKNHINRAGIKGIERLKADLEIGKPEMIVAIDREKARRFGLSTSAIGSELRTALFGKEISKFKQGEEDYGIQLRLMNQYRYDVDALMNKSIVFRDPANGKMHIVPISAVAKADLSTTFGAIRRKDLNRVITLSSNVEGGYNPTLVNDEIKKSLYSFEMPVGYAFKFGGEQEKQAQEMAFLSNALLIAIFMIFLIIVSQFNKITTPFIIMISVVLSTIGVFLGLIIFRMDFVVIMTMIGIISLAGIVVNNAIVLIDFIEVSRKKRRLELGVDKLEINQVIEAIALAGATRLRPVLLTAITTILGLIPLALGINIDFMKFLSEYDADFYLGGDNVAFWGPMSWTIIFGLTFATFLTLIIVPIMYLFFARINRKLGIS
ncbi:MAG: efflux RND transporter permease subunit [Flammeovirgaceae bacterium]|jgi:multidrug efflux pump|nr:efflux RND transporter permease subunit [Flammeovirgaceae bacterium]|tara:strand:- start:11621 stop:15037 length:3417 start_codon:yes stop_codon:yes gene_type:complete